MTRGITSYGVYIPTLRLDRAAIAAAHAWSFPALKAQGKGARALANWDEDTITMSVEAVRGLELANTGALLFASTTAPFADLQNASLIAAALGVGEGVSAMDFGGSLRAGVSALAAALTSAEAKPSVVVAADARRAKPGSAQEMQFGAGAAAIGVGSDAIIARLLSKASRADLFVDHFRESAQKHDYFWEERWVRDEGYLKIVPAAVNEVLRAAKVEPDDIAHFCMPGTLPGLAAAMAKKLLLPPNSIVGNFAAECGDAGAAQPLLMLCAALERAKPGEKILLAAFGAGCEVLLLETTEALGAYQAKMSVAAALASGRTEKHYTKLLSFHDELSLDWGMRAEGGEKIALTQQYRAQAQLSRFMGGKCPKCETVQFPQLASCVNCGAFEPLSPVSLADEKAKVATYTADWLQYYPSPPLYFGLVQFDNGARVMMEFVDVDPATLDVGTPLRMVYRLKSKDRERHYSRYFWKAAPIAPQGA